MIKNQEKKIKNFEDKIKLLTSDLDLYKDAAKKAMNDAFGKPGYEHLTQVMVKHPLNLSPTLLAFSEIDS